MTAKQYRRERIARGSQASVAKLLGVDVMTISRRERGELPINGEAEAALKSLPTLKCYICKSTPGNPSKLKPYCSRCGNQP
jgi:transcriptional regulator with XRE-family HTH domain